MYKAHELQPLLPGIAHGGVKVQKPWGSENCLVDNGTVAVWYLRINKGEATSLHAHRNKRTSMILLNGLARLEYLSDQRTISALDKTSFGLRFFHRTHALTDCDLLEVETPSDKSDVHRFKDNYGREGYGYEGPEHYQPLTYYDPQFRDNYFQVGNACARRLYELPYSTERDLISTRYAVIFLRGSLWSAQGVDVVIPGHVVWSDHLIELLKTTTPDKQLDLIQVWRQ